MKPVLFGVKLPQISKTELTNKINSLEINSKNSLYFFYSEFLLRANRNPWYKQVLNRADITAIDGKGLQWAMWQTIGGSKLAGFYGQYLIKLPFIFRVCSFIFLYLIELIKNLFLAFVTIAITKINFSKVTHNELILGRDYIYDILDIAEQKHWKTLIIGGNPANDFEIKTKLCKRYTKLNLEIWSKPSDSCLMKDILKIEPELGQNYKNIYEENWFEEANTYKYPELILNSQNLLNAFPGLSEAKNYVKSQKPDLLVVCLGGKSGKQEFFIDNLKIDDDISFTLAAGVGAALDHLGSGASQTVAPKWMLDSGLEWFHRFLTQPYRRLRVLDSIFSLWWWTTLQSFVNTGTSRKTAVSIISKKGTNEFLLAKRKNWVPGDVGWAFVQGGAEKAEDIALASLREIEEETGLGKNDFAWIEKPTEISEEFLTISFYRFLGQGAIYKSNQNYLSLLEYTGSGELNVNWENQKLAWIAKPKVFAYLPPEKVGFWTSSKDLFA